MCHELKVIFYIEMDETTMFTPLHTWYEPRDIAVGKTIPILLVSIWARFVCSQVIFFIHKETG
jgi:hypothetical protein